MGKSKPKVGPTSIYADVAKLAERLKNQHTADTLAESILLKLAVVQKEWDFLEYELSCEHEESIILNDKIDNLKDQLIDITRAHDDEQARAEHNQGHCAHWHERVINDESELRAATEEIARLRKILAKEPGVVMIAFESGDHQRLSSAVGKLQSKLTVCNTKIDGLVKERDDALGELNEARTSPLINKLNMSTFKSMSLDIVQRNEKIEKLEGLLKELLDAETELFTIKPHQEGVWTEMKIPSDAQVRHSAAVYNARAYWINPDDSLAHTKLADDVRKIEKLEGLLKPFADLRVTRFMVDGCKYNFRIDAADIRRARVASGNHSIKAPITRIPMDKPDSSGCWYPVELCTLPHCDCNELTKEHNSDPKHAQNNGTD